MKSLADLQADLVQKLSVYSDEHPAIKDLNRKIAALKRAIAEAPQISTTNDKSDKPDIATQALEQQEKDIEKNFDATNEKLTAARLGEAMERNQQAGHLRLIAYPEMPAKPIRPNKLKLFAIVIGLAGALAAASVAAAEMLDGSIRRTSDLARLVDRRLISVIPYMSTPDEDRRKRWKIIMLCTGLVAALIAATIVTVVTKLPVGAVNLQSSMGSPVRPN